MSFDSGAYVYDNPVVQRGLATEGVARAFTTTTGANWHPLTWLSIMLDCQLFGLDAGKHHLVSVSPQVARSPPWWPRAARARSRR